MENCYERLESFEEEVKEKLKSAEVLHCDETGIRMEGKTGWFHTASTEDFTYYEVDDKRGKAALDRIGILEGYKGTVIHDCLPAYFQYEVLHGLCNAHLLRELKYVWEEMKQNWALEMSELLKGFQKEKSSKGIPDEAGYEERIKAYEAILLKGQEEQPPPVPRLEGQRGRTAQSKSQNLLSRLKRHEDAVLAFMRKEEVPFTNNRAEQDIRMVKVKMKVSGGFRTKEGAKILVIVKNRVDLPPYISNKFRQRTSVTVL
jgi:transposase